MNGESHTLSQCLQCLKSVKFLGFGKNVSIISTERIMKQQQNISYLDKKRIYALLHSHGKYDTKKEAHTSHRCIELVNSRADCFITNI